MKKKFIEEKLKQGDILLTTTIKPISGVIRAFTKSDISHVMLYVKPYSVIDATDEGVQARNTQRIYLHKDSSAYVLRVKGGLSDQQFKIINYKIRIQIGIEYSKGEAIIAGLGGSNDWSKKQFCSRLVAQAFQEAGIKLVDNPNYCSPEEIKNSKELEVINEAIVLMEDPKDDDVNLPQLMRDCTNFILEGARKRDSSIQGFNDLYAYLKAKPEEDNYISQLYIDSGYLELWKIEMTVNSWLYDFDDFNRAEMPNEEKRNVCKRMIPDISNSIHMRMSELAKVKSVFIEYPFTTFKNLIRLYENLIILHKTSSEVIQKWLSLNS